MRSVWAIWAAGGGERDLHTELEARAGPALADALHIGGVQGIDLLVPTILAALAQELGDALEPGL